MSMVIEVESPNTFNFGKKAMQTIEINMETKK
jgi:hypothetical protein